MLKGGFLGVDMSFVISGFLITSLILIEKQSTGAFSFLNFYERRSRRLLPALFVVVFASWPVAWFILLPSEIIDFVKSQIASVFFLSNLYWFSESLQYGGRSGLFEPFLHTWSLAVEEQFYIFFPIVYLLALRFIRNDTSLIVIGVTSIVACFVFAHVMTTLSANLSFYWLPSRVWELLAGAVLAHTLYIAPELGRRPWALRLLPVVGLVLILVPMFVMELSWAHPGAGTVATVVGTVLVIWFANPNDPVTRALSNRTMIFVGLISYSLYLWHYPIFAFGRMIDADPDLISKSVWFLLSIGLAILSYYYIEKPFRTSKIISVRVLVSTTAASVFAVVAFAATIISTDGLRARLPDLIALYGQNEFDNEFLRMESWKPLAAISSAGLDDETLTESSPTYESEYLWFDPNSDDQKVLIVGDSHSKDMFNAFYLNRPFFEGFEFARFGMDARLQGKDVSRLVSSPNFARADTIVLSFRYNTGTVAALREFIYELEKHGKTVVLMLNTVEFVGRANLPVFDFFIRESGHPFDPQALNELAWDQRFLARIESLNRALQDVGKDAGVLVLDKAEFMCDPVNETCRLVTDDGYKSLYDYGHYTIEGATFFGQVIAETGWWPHDSLAER